MVKNFRLIGCVTLYKIERAEFLSPIKIVIYKIIPDWISIDIKQLSSLNFCTIKLDSIFAYTLNLNKNSVSVFQQKNYNYLL